MTGIGIAAAHQHVVGVALPARARHHWIVPVLCGAAAAMLSIGRLLLTNPDVLTQVLWAEDGLFPMCVVQAGFLDCLVEPFAGYLLFGPRVLAGVVALTPFAAWSMVANAIAAAIAGATGLALSWHLIHRGFSAVAACAVGLLPVLLPLVGLESINAIGSMYMPMLLLALVMTALPPSGRGGTWFVAGLLVLTAMTIPSAIVVLFILAMLRLRSWIPARQGTTWLIALGVGLLPQLLVVVTAEQRRPLATDAGALLAWADGTATAVSSLLPGMSLTAQAPSFDALKIHGWSHPGVLITLVIVAVGVVGYLRARDPAPGQLSVLVLAGVLSGLIPSAISGPSNRYYVVPLLCWMAAFVLGLDDWARRRTRRWLTPVTVLVLALLWLPSVPASAFRALSGPDWSVVVTRAEAECGLKPSGSAAFLFSPNWPYGDGGLPIPSVLACSRIHARG